MDREGSFEVQYWYSKEEAVAWMFEQGGVMYAVFVMPDNVLYATKDGFIWKLNHMSNGVWDWRKIAQVVL